MAKTQCFFINHVHTEEFIFCWAPKVDLCCGSDLTNQLCLFGTINNGINRINVFEKLLIMNKIR